MDFKSCSDLSLALAIDEKVLYDATQHVEQPQARDPDSPCYPGEEASTTYTATSDSYTSEKRISKAWDAVVNESAVANIVPVRPDFNHQTLTPSNRPWKPTSCRLGPLSGIASILIAVSSIIAALGVLLGSQGASKADWTWQPSTYLAICTAIANQSMRYAALQGACVIQISTEAL